MGCKKVRGQSEATLQTLKQAGATKRFDISSGQEVALSNICNSLNDTQYYSIFSQV